MPRDGFPAVLKLYTGSHEEEFSYSWFKKYSKTYGQIHEEY